MNHRIYQKDVKLQSGLHFSASNHTTANFFHRITSVSLPLLCLLEKLENTTDCSPAHAIRLHTPLLFICREYWIKGSWCVLFQLSWHYVQTTAWKWNKILRLQKIIKFWPHSDNRHNISVKSEGEDCFWTVYLLTFGSHETTDQPWEYCC